MHLAELKQKSIADLNDVARDLKIEGAANLRKQELIFAILQAQTEKNGVIFGEGVLDFGQLLPELNRSGVPTDWWVIDLCFWPDAWAVTERCKRAVDDLNRRYG